MHIAELGGVEALLAAGADPNAGGGMALQDAAHNGHLLCVEALLAVGADPNVRARQA